MVAVSRIDNQQVNACVHEGRNAFKSICRSADSSTDEQLTILVKACVRVVFALQDVRHRDEALQSTRSVHERELFNALFGEDFLRLGKAHLRACRHRILGHDRANFHVHVANGAEVAAREHTDELTLGENRETAHLVASALFKSSRHRFIGIKRHRIGHNTGLPALDLANFFGLVFNGHILVDNAEATLQSKGNSQRSRRNGIHCSTDYRNVQLDIRGELGAHIRLSRKNRRFSGNE